MREVVWVLLAFAALYLTAYACAVSLIALCRAGTATERESRQHIQELLGHRCPCGNPIINTTERSHVYQCACGREYEIVIH